MSVVLFHVDSGEYVNEYLSEDEARVEMHSANIKAGWTRIYRSWIDGIEREWSSNKRGKKKFAPYGITESNRWNRKYNAEK